MKEIVKTNGLTKQYGENLCVSNLNMSVKEGAIYGFLGPNGAGKSTTLKMLWGLCIPQREKLICLESACMQKAGWKF